MIRQALVCLLVSVLCVSTTVPAAAFEDPDPPPLPYVYVDHTSANGAGEGKFFEWNNWPTVTVTIKNPHKFWTRIKGFEYYDNSVVPLPGWAQLGYIPGGGKAKYKITFNRMYTTKVGFFLNAGASQDGETPAGFITVMFRLIDTILEAAGASPGDVENAEPETVIAAMKLLTKLPSCYNGYEKLLERDSIGAVEMFRKCLTDDDQAKIIVKIAESLGTTASSNLSLSRVKTGLKIVKLAELLWEVGDNILAIASGSVAGSVWFCSVSQPIYAPLPKGVKPIAIKSSTPKDLSRFLQDMTIPDNTVVKPGETLLKTWRIKNIGNSTWTSDYKMVYVEGVNLSGQDSVLLSNTEPQHEIEISVPVKIPADAKPGTYTSKWRLSNASKQKFGNVVWYIVRVAAPGAPTVATQPVAVMQPVAAETTPPVPTALPTEAPTVEVAPTATPLPTQPPPSAQISFRVDSSSITAGSCTTLRWDVDNVREIYLIRSGGTNVGVVGHGSQEVCLNETDYYELRVVHTDGHETTDRLTIAVEQGNAAPTPVPSTAQINFWADTNVLNAGDCTGIHWDVQNVREVYFGMAGGGTNGVPGRSDQVACLSESRTLVLRIIHMDGHEEIRELPISVAAAPVLQPPSAPSNVSPGNNTNQWDPSFTLVWNGVPGATEYFVEFWAPTPPNDGSQAQADSGWITATNWLISPGNAYTYNWHVKARNSAGESGWSETWLFCRKDTSTPTTEGQSGTPHISQLGMPGICH